MSGVLMDAHCHLHEYGDDEVESIMNLSMYIIAVSDNYNSSIRTVEISKRYRLVIPAVGLHPWNVGPDYKSEIAGVERLLSENDMVRILGEVGLDRKFRPHTTQYQDAVFRGFIEMARERGLALNVHAANAWIDVLNALYRNDIPLAILHWYTGPADLVKDIADRGYYITANPALAVQQRYRDVVKVAPLDIMLVESDAPYNYRGFVFHPREISATFRYIAELKGMSFDEVRKSIMENSYKFLRTLRIL
ncbi:MAG: TatD family hydrolase [Ignisphaera sp.]|nr:TatD family hydrolase [Ignisphaera sp.]